nr:unnamed protein product [Callosobruchus chinensis]
MIRGEAFYRSDFGVQKTATKRGRNLYSLQPRVLSLQGSLKGNKSTIDKHLKSNYGQDWRSQEEYEYEDKATAMMV